MDDKNIIIESRTVFNNIMQKLKRGGQSYGSDYISVYISDYEYPAVIFSIDEINKYGPLENTIYVHISDVDAFNKVISNKEYIELIALLKQYKDSFIEMYLLYYKYPYKNDNSRIINDVDIINQMVTKRLINVLYDNNQLMRDYIINKIKQLSGNVDYMIDYPTLLTEISPFTDNKNFVLYLWILLYKFNKYLVVMNENQKKLLYDHITDNSNIKLYELSRYDSYHDILSYNEFAYKNILGGYTSNRILGTVTLTNTNILLDCIKLPNKMIICNYISHTGNGSLRLLNQYGDYPYEFIEYQINSDIINLVDRYAYNSTNFDLLFNELKRLFIDKKILLDGSEDITHDATALSFIEKFRKHLSEKRTN